MALSLGINQRVTFEDGTDFGASGSGTFFERSGIAGRINGLATLTPSGPGIGGLVILYLDGNAMGRINAGGSTAIQRYLDHNDNTGLFAERVFIEKTGSLGNLANLGIFFRDSIALEFLATTGGAAKGTKIFLQYETTPY